MQRLGGRRVKHYERSENSFVWPRETNHFSVKSQCKHSHFMSMYIGISICIHISALFATVKT